MAIDNADDTQLFVGQSEADEKESLGHYLPECTHGTILVTTRNIQTGSKLT